jgi:hypothetical protein
VFALLGWQVLTSEASGTPSRTSIEAIGALDPDVLIFQSTGMRKAVAGSPQWRETDKETEIGNFSCFRCFRWAIPLEPHRRATAAPIPGRLGARPTAQKPPPRFTSVGEL